MTKKDFEAIAYALKECRRGLRDIDLNIVNGVAEAMASVCARTNARFNRSRFLTACGVPTDD